MKFKEFAESSRELLKKWVNCYEMNLVKEGMQRVTSEEMQGELVCNVAQVIRNMASLDLNEYAEVLDMRLKHWMDLQTAQYSQWESGKDLLELVANGDGTNEAELLTKVVFRIYVSCGMALAQYGMDLSQIINTMLCKGKIERGEIQSWDALMLPLGMPIVNLTKAYRDKLPSTSTAEYVQLNMVFNALSRNTRISIM